MHCAEARDLLLRSEGPPAGPLAAHLGTCDACARLASDLAQVEDAWRAIPLPVDAGRGREAFLARLADLPAPSRGRSPRRWLVAASALVALGLWGGVLASGRRASASSDVVERLVEWNLSLAGSGSPGERGRIYAEKAPGLASEVERAGLPDGDRELADALLENAPRLARQADPLLDADRLDDLADRLLRRMDHAAQLGDDGRRVERYARLYNRVVGLGIGARFDLLEESAALDFDRRRQVERLVLRDDDRMKALVELLERAPDSSRKEIRKALGIARRPKATPDPARKPKPKNKKPKPAPADSRNAPALVP